MALIDVLSSGKPVVSVELRPPMAELNATAGMDAWIDTYHSVSGLVRDGMPVFLTDSAVGVREEHNLRHLVTNLGTRVPRDQVVPFQRREVMRFDPAMKPRPAVMLGENEAFCASVRCGRIWNA